MRIADRLRAFADLLDERDAQPSRFGAAGDETHVVISFRVLGCGNELVLAVNQPHTQAPRQKPLLLDPDALKLDLDYADETPKLGCDRSELHHRILRRLGYASRANEDL